MDFYEIINSISDKIDYGLVVGVIALIVAVCSVIASYHIYRKNVEWDKKKFEVEYYSKFLEINKELISNLYLLIQNKNDEEFFNKTSDIEKLIGDLDLYSEIGGIKESINNYFKTIINIKIILTVISNNSELNLIEKNILSKIKKELPKDNREHLIDYLFNKISLVILENSKIREEITKLIKETYFK